MKALFTTIVLALFALCTPMSGLAQDKGKADDKGDDKK